MDSADGLATVSVVSFLRVPNHFRPPGSLLLGSSLAFVLSSIAPGQSPGLDLKGDSSFDVDRISCSLTPPRRWLSHPGGRLCLNPSSHKEFKIEPLAADLPLDLGAYAGTKIIRLPRILTARVIAPGDSSTAAAAPAESWSPYQLRFTSKQPGGALIEGSDFFPDAQPALIRLLEIRNAAGAKLRLTGQAAATITDDGTLCVSTESCHYALTFRRIGPSASPPLAIGVRPTAGPDGWSLEIPLAGEVTKIAVGFGFSTHTDGIQQASLRANAVFTRPIEASLAISRDAMSSMLGKVPLPRSFGISSGSSTISADDHRAAYYAAWAFLIQSSIDPLPDHPDYPFPQMSLGKGALWAEGHPKCPATCGWESFLGIQTLAWIDPDFGWRAYEGIMSLVDEHGQLGGESLPSRKAHTAWVLHQRKPDPARLSAVYPAIRRYLLWRERNPRWIYGDNMAPDERDIEFAASWMVDVDYAIRIADVLSNNSDAVMWREKQRTMIDHMRSWFFRDPRKIHQFWFTDRKVHSTPQRNEYRPVMILSALATPGLPDDMRDRLLPLFRDHFKPAAPNAGFAYTKYPDNQFLAWGLIDHRQPEARSFIEALLRDSITCGEFAETIEIGKDGKPFPGGVKPSLFTALNLIEFTWLLNGVRAESGTALPFHFQGSPP